MAAPAAAVPTPLYMESKADEKTRRALHAAQCAYLASSRARVNLMGGASPWRR